METKITLFQKKEIRKTLHGNEWWFVITDVVAALTDSVNPSDYLKKMRLRDSSLGEAFKGGQIVPPWQFAYDFHNTGRAYLKGEDTSGLWADYQKPGRGSHTRSDRSVFPLRSLIPEKMDGLIGAQGNVGFSSIVSAAIRLHDQRIHIGQAAAALVAISLKHQQQPRDLASDPTRLEEVRHALCGDTSGVPMLLWPYRDLPANHPAFVAINRLAARSLLPMSQGEVDFQPDAPATAEWRNAVLKLCTGYDLNLTQPADEKLTRGEFARQLWQRIEKQALPPKGSP